MKSILVWGHSTTMWTQFWPSMDLLMTPSSYPSNYWMPLFGVLVSSIIYFLIPLIVSFLEKIVVMEILVDHWSGKITPITPITKSAWSVSEPKIVQKVHREFIPEWQNTWIGLKVNYSLSFWNLIGCTSNQLITQ